MLALKELSMCTAVSGGLLILSHAHGACPNPPPTAAILGEQASY